MMASARRVLEVIKTPASVPDSGRFSVVVRSLRYGLLLEGISFKYGTAQFALQGVDVHIPPGTAMAIVGRSGSGKSTLARLCVRLADPTIGSVRVERRLASDYTLRALREIVCYIPQHPILFSGSIRDNLRYANLVAADREIDQVIEVAQLKPVLRRFSRGLDHTLGAGASGLSGGEQQRLAIARALLRDSAILILDEATSALDMPTELALLRAIRIFRPELTMIIISHRLKSLTWVDRFVVLEAGRIVGDGDHSTLWSNNQIYRMLLNAGPEIYLREVTEERIDLSQTKSSFDVSANQGRRNGLDVAR